MDDRAGNGAEEAKPTSDGQPADKPERDDDFEFGSDAEHLRLLFDCMLEGFAYCRMIYDARGRPDDFVYLEVNRAFATLTGLTDVTGRRVTEVIPGIKDSNPELFEIYDRVTRTGVREEFEVEVVQLRLSLRVSVFRPEAGHFVAVFENITERKRVERELVKLNHFLELRIEQRTNDLAEALELLKRAQSQCEE